MTTAKKSAASRRTKSEDLAAEAATPAKPKGSPNLYPFAALPRRQRAQFMRKLDVVMTRQDALDVSEDGTLELSDAAEAYELMADMEDLLAVAAEDADAFSAWAAKAGDGEITDLLTWYIARFSVGEA